MNGTGGSYLVSVQDPGLLGTPADRHRALGVLLAADTVIVPRVPDGFLEDGDPLPDVVVVPVAADGTANGGWSIRTAYVDVWQLPGAEPTRVAVARLAWGSPVEPRRVIIDCASLVADLQSRDGDMWAALDELELTEGAWRGDPTPLLEGLPPLRTASPAVRAQTIVSWDGTEEPICRWLGWCRLTEP